MSGTSDKRQVLRAAGAPLDRCSAAVVAIHGRGQSSDYMLEHLVCPLSLEEVAFVFPEAPGGSWYPGRFDAPPAENEPWLSHALARCEAALDGVRVAGVEPMRTVLVGFSQGACLAATLLARRGGPLGGAAILTGALIGAPGEAAAMECQLDGLPIVVTCSSMDEWVPLVRARETAEAFAAAGASVRFIPRNDPQHRISAGDVAAVRELVSKAMRYAGTE